MIEIKCGKIDLRPFTTRINNFDRTLAAQNIVQILISNSNYINHFINPKKE